MAKFSLGISALTLALSLAAGLVHGDEQKHTIAVDLSSGTGEYKGSKQDGDGFAFAYIYYNYQAFENFSLEVGYLGGTHVDDWDCDEDEGDWTCSVNDDDNLFNLNANEFTLDSLVFALKGQFPLSQRNSLYGKIGAQYYDYDFNYKNNSLAEDDGIGVLLEAGWQYRWDNGIGMNAGIRYQDLGDITFKTRNIGISYSF